MAATSTTTDSADQNDVYFPELEDKFNNSTFEQILEMDEEDSSRDFSKSIYNGFFDQAEETFSKMEEALDQSEPDLDVLSSLGHFLKGSSATLGLTKVQETCEKIQQYGRRIDDDGSVKETSDDLFLKRIRDLLKVVKKQYNEVKVVLEKFYNN